MISHLCVATHTHRHIQTYETVVLNVILRKAKVSVENVNDHYLQSFYYYCSVELIYKYSINSRCCVTDALVLARQRSEQSYTWNMLRLRPWSEAGFHFFTK